ncbi:hypothetical protein BDZ89DRAFT_1034730 [Hymenopellis radicata]|nr:hypothetical protein BDZ89DRAFT_1034730 [Hymenopellis radicata]
MFVSATVVSASALVLLAGQALGHGKITSPPPRSDTVGDAFGAACGTQLLSVVTSDPYGNIEGEEQITSSSSSCNLWICKGYQFDDNAAFVQSYTAGQVIDMEVEIRAPHTGYANVSIVSTSTNTIIGDTLISWDDYASTATGVTSDETSFSITMPDLGSQCATAGDCVIQWFWYAPPGVDQTYEDCIDFVMDGSGSGSGSSSSVETSAPAATPVVTSATAAFEASSSSVATLSAVTPASSTDTTTSASTPSPTGTSCTASCCCQNEYNACAAAGGSDCEAAAETCMETVQTIRKIKRSGTLGRRLY